MTLQEKIGQMVQVAGPKGDIPNALRQQLREGRIGSILNVTDPAISCELQRIAVEESRLGIPLIMGRDVIHGYRTIFPIPLALAATWDPQTAETCARVAAREASAAGFHWTFAPMMDITRDPRWGRIAEGFGEDPYLASLFAAAMVRGFQGNDLSSPDTLAACAKHFAGYGAAEGGRDYDAAVLSENLLRDVYLPPFKAAVDANVATVMTAFNEINGVPATGNVDLLRRILREEWEFSGFVVSDWKSVEEMVNHGFCEDGRDAARKAVEAGVDMEMQSSAYSDHLEELVATGEIREALIDDAAGRILDVKFRLGLFGERPLYRAAVPAPPEREALLQAKNAALRSIVLLKNNGILPLSPGTRRIAVVGPLADDPYEVLGTWNRDGRTEDTITPLAAIRNLLGGTAEILYACGMGYSRSKDTTGFAEAVQCARKAEVVIFFAGEEAILSGEGHSRAYLNLPGTQEMLLDELAATGTPIVLVVLAGRPLIVGKAAQKAAAVLYGWHPGTMGGPALADLIFGVESPSGKLPITFPKAEGQIPVYCAHKNTGRPPEKLSITMIDDIPLRAYQSSLGDAARYLDIGYQPQYPFGYGLSYTKFEYSDLRLSAVTVPPGGTIQASVKLANSGTMEAEEVVQLYVRDVTGSLTRPVKELKGFQRIRLKPGEERIVSFDIETATLGFHNSAMQYVVEPGRFTLWIGGDSQSGLMAEFRLLSAEDAKKR